MDKEKALEPRRTRMNDELEEENGIITLPFHAFIASLTEWLPESLNE